MALVKIPKTVTIYGPRGQVYKGEAPEALVDEPVKKAIEKAVKQAEANRDRHAKYAGHKESDLLVKQFEEEIADLKGETPPADPPQGEKGKGKGKGKAGK